MKNTTICRYFGARSVKINSNVQTLNSQALLKQIWLDRGQTFKLKLCVFGILRTFLLIEKALMAVGVSK